jgi:lysozyme
MLREVCKPAIDLIKRYEKFVDHTYICPAGYPTIGWGHVVRQGEIFGFIDEIIGEELLRKDLNKAVNGVLRYILTPLTDNQFGALVSFTFNAGNGALQRSTLRMRINRGDFDVANEFAKYNKYGRPLKVSRGLTRRRLEEANLFGDV